MTEIKLYNTATRSKEVFAPLDPDNVRMYVCGPTVYDRAHLGNARPAIVFDVLYRLLRHEYGQAHVTYVRNLTDVDDKINAEAQRRKEAGAPGTLEELIAGRAEETIRWYHEDMDALGVLRPDHEPRATQYIAQMIAMIEGLIADGYAYENEGHVLFRVRKYADYGKLSGRSIDDMIAGSRVEVAPYKEDPMDFVLWKPSSDELPGWDSPWGRGRPGWHIECSAMAAELLGETFDIHGGGNDLQFPHHENEIAQSKCAGHGFAKVWLHNEMLQVEGKKMSKSLGNFFTVRDLLDQGVPGEVIRFVMLSTHYRKPMDWTESKMREAMNTLRAWRSETNEERGSEASKEVIGYLVNDLDTAGAIGELHKLFEQSRFQELKASAGLMGFLDERLRWIGRFDLNQAVSEQLETVFEIYQEARQTRNFETIDRLKDQLAAKGVSLKFSKSSVDIGSVDMFKLFLSYQNMSPEMRKSVFGDAVHETEGSSSIQPEALSYAYVASAISEALNQ